MNALKKILVQLPGIGEYIRTRDSLAVPGALWALPGHFYSPIPSPQDIDEGTKEPALDRARLTPWLNHNLDSQLALIEELGNFYESLPFHARPNDDTRYYLENDFYGYADGVIFYCLLRHLAPKRIIEVGSGFSSALILDVNERFFDDSIDVTCIEPYPKQLKALLKNGETNLHIIEKRVQDVPLPTFDELAAGDILFIDSSHISKVNSDVHFLFFEVIPRLKPGVIIHVHDVFAGFEYPREWLVEGRVWNEQYLLRALLMGNSHLEILLMTHFLQTNYPDLLQEKLPLTMQDRGGSIWLRTK